MRAAIYARFSSDLQSPTSIADQVRECRAKADALGAEVVEVYADAALSGADARHRPALQRLMRDARAGRFDVVIAEALDRVSRDQEDTAAIFKRLSFAGVKIVTLAEGEVAELHVAFRGAMNSLFLRDLAAKVRRGQRGRVEAGASPGGLCYGYRAAPRVGDGGSVILGGREIVEPEAAIVRRIFARFLAGASPREIAGELNADRVPAPRGGTWRSGTIRGHGPRATGILRNPIYAGRLAWNRQRFTRNPDTGRRIARPTPASERVVVEAPALAIVSREDFDAAQARLAGSPIAGRRRRPDRRRKHVLAGLVVCGSCGEPYVVQRADTMKCRRHVNGGSASCSNGKLVRIADLTRRALAGLRASLLDPAALDAFCREYRAARRVRDAKASQRAREREREASDLEARRARLVALVEAGAGDVEAIVARIRDLEARLAEVRRPEPAAPEVLELHPSLPDLYRRTVDAFVAGALPPEKAADVVGRLIDRIIIHPEVGKGAYRAELVGSLASLIAGQNEAGTDQRVAMVAAGRFALAPLIRRRFI